MNFGLNETWKQQKLQNPERVMEKKSTCNGEKGGRQWSFHSATLERERKRERERDDESKGRRRQNGLLLLLD